MSALPAAHPGELDLAHQLLQRLEDRFGTAGLAAAASRPGLLAAIDQHAAAVRDRIATGAAMLVELASYADGLIDRATQRGWYPSTAPVTDWDDADPITLRVLGICALHRWVSVRGATLAS